MRITQADIDRMTASDAQREERIRMVARVQRKRIERNRTLERRAQRFGKFAMQGRI